MNNPVAKKMWRSGATMSLRCCVSKEVSIHVLLSSARTYFEYGDYFGKIVFGVDWQPLEEESTYVY